MKKLLKFLRTLRARHSIRRSIKKVSPLKIVFGAGTTCYPGWISTDYPVLDVTDDKSWGCLFRANQIDALLSEHVFEHLTDAQIAASISNIYKYLKKGGYVRIAVPDAFHPNLEYIEMVKPGGSGSGADDHKQLLNYKTLSSKFTEMGFKVLMLEWFDEKGDFNFRNWISEQGMISRSSRYDERNLCKPLSYTSLIFDAYKI